MQHPVKYFHKRLNSTNLYVSKMLTKQIAKQPFWVRTDDQFAGKGQGKKTWTSEPGQNLTGTLAIFPVQLEGCYQYDLLKIFALSTACFLELFIDETRIKWPNDLYVGDKKIGGILIETGILGKWIDHALFGAGININQVKFPPSIPNPISISMLTGLRYDLDEMENLFLDTFLNQYTFIESGRFNEINNLYINKLYRFDEESAFTTGGKTFNARIIGVNEFGHLLLETDSGKIQSYDYQDVEYII
jgi:BirA family transcriptional regulator, biotin operon repressor / biotin---[acetyl-CoA-carboxylase] ligase